MSSTNVTHSKMSTHRHTQTHTYTHAHTHTQTHTNIGSGEEHTVRGQKASQSYRSFGSDAAWQISPFTSLYRTAHCNQVSPCSCALCLFVFYIKCTYSWTLLYFGFGFYLFIFETSFSETSIQYRWTRTYLQKKRKVITSFYRHRRGFCGGML